MPEALAKLSLTPRSARLLERMEDSLDGKSALDGLRAVLDRQGRLAAGYIVKNKLSGQALRRRTGGLARSIEGRVINDAQGVPAVRVGVFRGPALSYAGVLEHGTRDRNPASPYPIIRPVRARALAMPVGDSLTPAGVPRIPGPRDYPKRYGRDLVFVPFRRGIAIGGLYDERELDAAEARSDQGAVSLRGLSPRYVLLKQLSITPRHYLRDGLIEYLPRIGDAIGEFLEEHYDPGEK